MWFIIVDRNEKKTDLPMLVICESNESEALVTFNEYANIYKYHKVYLTKVEQVGVNR